MVHGHRRLAFFTALAAAIVAVLTFANAGHFSTRFLIGWDVGLGLYLVTTLFGIAHFDLKRVQTFAAEQDEGAIAVLVLTVCAALASLVAVVIFLGGAKQGDGPKAIYFALAVGTIFLSWCAIHTVFALHYAHEFYGSAHGRKHGGLRFPDDPQPDYWDFMYFSFVIGMTFQVSDVQVTSKGLRHLVVVHGIVSFLFSVAILALAVNIGSNLI